GVQTCALPIFQLQAEAGQVQLGVEGQGRVAGGQHETVASDPVRIGRVVAHHLLEEGVGSGREAHRRTRMAVANLLYGIGGQDAGGVHGPLVQFGPLEVCGGRLGAHPESGLLSTCRMPVISHRRGRAYPRRTCDFSSHSRLPGLLGIRLPTGKHRHSADEYGAAHPGAQSSFDPHLRDPRETPRDAVFQHEPTPANVRVWATATVAWYARAFTVASHAEACWDVSVGVCVTAVESRPPGVLGASQSPARRPFGARVMAFVALTKPRIIELLLITTVPVMFLAQQGVPDLTLVLLTCVGGYLSAGGANALNMYIDRDIDALMDRTAQRPLVTGMV